MKISFVDYRISENEYANLSKHVDKIILVPKNPTLYQSIDGHPDIQLAIIKNERAHLIVQKDIEDSFIKELSSLDIDFLYSNSSLKDSYPFDIHLNAVTLKDYFIHSLKYSDETILSLLNNRMKINVKQGYTKCSSLVVNDNSIITSDKSIYNALMPHGLDVLLISPGNIKLPGLNCGFIGGCTGLIDHNKLAIYGNLDFHPEGKEIKEFLKKHNVETIYLNDGPLIDRGSILSFY